MKQNSFNLVLIGTLFVGIMVGYFLFSPPKMQQDEIVPEEYEASLWTCSMHPQIRQEEPGLCPLCKMELVPLDGEHSHQENELEMTPAAVQLAQIQTTVIETNPTNKHSSLDLNGRLQVDETQIARLVNHIPGRIEKLAVSYTGATVQKGQILAWIYAPEIITAQKEVLEAQKIGALSPELLNAALKKLSYWKISDALIEELLSTQQLKETIPIMADYSGVVTQKNIAVGDYVTQGEVLFEVQDLSRLWAVFDVYEQNLTTIEEGQTLRFSTPAHLNQTFGGKIIFIDPRIDPQTRTAQVRVEIDNKKGLLKPEMFIKGQLEVKNNSDTLLVPKSAVLWTGKRSVVYIQLENRAVPTFAFREVVLGTSVGDSYEILEGLVQGEEVVTNGAFLLDASAQLNNQASMMNRMVRVKNTEAHAPIKTQQAMVSMEFQNQLTSLTETYLTLKNALVKSAEQKSIEAAQAMELSLRQIDETLLNEQHQNHWKAEKEKLWGSLQKLTTAENLENQRQQFQMVSQALITMLQNFGSSKQPYYVQHCPMANNQNGAHWLSDQELIENPYYGAAMLRCGSVVDTLGSSSLSIN